MGEKTAWENYEPRQQKEVSALSEAYKQFLSNAKTERECVTEAIRLAKEKGYQNFFDVMKEQKKIVPGMKLYLQQMNKTVVFFLIGTEPLATGMNILGAHIDSPRLDLKQNPLYEDSGLALLDTHYYGGIKKYQWVALPLALHGVVIRKDGSKVPFVIGEKEDDPVFGVSDLLIHLSKEQLKKKGDELIKGEDLNVLIGSMPLKEAEKDAVKENIKQLLWEQYQIKEEDFLSAEIEVVPAGAARDYGLDRSMVMGYGQDDRVCAYTSLMALLEVEQSNKTCACLLVDKEEIGSVGATGMHSRFFENAVIELLDYMGQYTEVAFRRTMTHSKMLSSDVSAAFDPNYPSVMEKKNAAYFGRGIVLNKYTGSRGKAGCNDANPEFIANLRAILEKHGVLFQTAELGKVDEGGGGTIAYILAAYGMEVIDCGVPLHNMHAPWEIASKADIYEAKRGYYAFLVEA